MDSHADPQLENLLDRHGLAWRLWPIRLDEVEHHPSRARGGAGGRRGPSPLRTVRRHAIELLDVDVATVVADCLPVDRAATADSAFRAAKHLAAIAAALKEADTP